MARQCVVAVYGDFQGAKSGVQALERSGFPADQISLVTHSVEDEVPRPHEMEYGDSAEKTAAKGAGVGGLVGLALGTPLLAIPGVGPMLVVGPLAAGLTGAIVGGFLGSMAGWGVPNDNVRAYEEQVREGAMLVVASGDPQQVADAKEVLEKTDSTSVQLHAQTSADDVEP